VESAVEKWVADTDSYMFGAVVVNHARIDPARLHDLVTTIARATVGQSRLFHGQSLADFDIPSSDFPTGATIRS